MQNGATDSSSNASPRRKLTAVMSPFRPAGSKLVASTADIVDPLQRAISAYRAQHPGSGAPQLLVARTSVSLAPAAPDDVLGGSRSLSPLLMSPNNVDALRDSTRRNDAVSHSLNIPTRPRSSSPVRNAPPPSSSPMWHPQSQKTAAGAASEAAAAMGVGGMVSPSAVRSEAPTTAALAAEVRLLKDANRRLEDNMRAADESLRTTTEELEIVRHQLFVAGAEQQRAATALAELGAAFEEVKALSAAALSEQQAAQQQLVEERDAAVEQLLAARREIDRLRRAVRELLDTPAERGGGPHQ